MPDLVNIYCDESCHLEHSPDHTMVLGALWCPTDSARTTAAALRELKQVHRMPEHFELKWTKVAPKRIEYFRAVLDYFFETPALHFRAVVIPDKTQLRHADFDQDHDTWYYKMLFALLEPLLSPENIHHVYLDMKDTRSADKVAKLQDVLCSNLYDFNRAIVPRVQVVRSNEVEHIQLTDFLMGIVAYANRGLATNTSKLSLVQQMRDRSKYTLTKTTLLREQKVNVFIWSSR